MVQFFLEWKLNNVTEKHPNKAKQLCTSVILNFLLILTLATYVKFTQMKTLAVCHNVVFCDLSFFQDTDMLYEPTNTPAMARTSNLNEELGQVNNAPEITL